MKKLILLLIVALFSLSVNAQKTVLETGMYFTATMHINHETLDTTFTMHHTFRNERYDHIIDTGILYFNSKENVIQFADQVDYLLSLQKGTTDNVPFQLYGHYKGYVTNDWLHSRFMIKDNENKYFSISKSNVKEMADEARKLANKYMK